MQRLEHSFHAMGGPCQLRVDHNIEATALAAIAAAEAEVRRLEARYSRYLEHSITSQINFHAGVQPVPIDAETAGLLQHADTLWRESDGMFDLTSGVLRRAWDFRSGRIPGESELEPLLGKIGWQKLEWSEDSAFLPETGMELDFGGCVKEYAADSAAAKLRAEGVDHALVDLAGDIATVGPQGDGQPWSIGVRDPALRESAIAGLPLSGGAIASSGDYERCIEIAGRRYGHILNPTTGWPVAGLVAVSISAPQCLVAGSAATLAMLKPEEEALIWLAGLGLPWVAVDQRGRCHSG